MSSPPAAKRAKLTSTPALVTATSADSARLLVSPQPTASAAITAAVELEQRASAGPLTAAEIEVLLQTFKAEAQEAAQQKVEAVEAEARQRIEAAEAEAAEARRAQDWRPRSKKSRPWKPIWRLRANSKPHFVRIQHKFTLRHDHDTLGILQFLYRVITVLVEHG